MTYSFHEVSAFLLCSIFITNTLIILSWVAPVRIALQNTIGLPINMENIHDLLDTSRTMHVEISDHEHMAWYHHRNCHEIFLESPISWKWHLHCKDFGTGYQVCLASCSYKFIITYIALTWLWMFSTITWIHSGFIDLKLRQVNLQFFLCRLLQTLHLAVIFITLDYTRGPKQVPFQVERGKNPHLKQVDASAYHFKYNYSINCMV